MILTHELVGANFNVGEVTYNLYKHEFSLKALKSRYIIITCIILQFIFNIIRLISALLWNKILYWIHQSRIHHTLDNNGQTNGRGKAVLALTMS